MVKRQPWKSDTPASSSGSAHAPASSSSSARRAPARPLEGGEPNSTRPKLLDFTHTGSHLSARGLESVLMKVHREGLPESGLSRQTIQRSREQLSRDTTPYVTLLQSVQVNHAQQGLVNLPVQAPLPILYNTISTSAAFSDAVEKALVAKPPTAADPWRLVVYGDEITCGQTLRVDNKRKVEGVYWSIMDLGSLALSQEHSWFEISAWSTHTVCDLTAEMSQVMTRMLACFFLTRVGLTHAWASRCD